MRAILLAAGLGTRLRPLTDRVPKCLVPINGKPLLQFWLERLTEAGIGPFLVNTHYLAEQVDAYVLSSPFVDHVTLVNEPELLGTAGTLTANLDFFRNEDGMLIHADNYCLADMRLFAKAHSERPPGCLMTMMTFRTDDPSSCGILEVNKRGIVFGFHEKVPNPPGNLANGAIYILSGEMIQFLQCNPGAYSDFSKDVIPRMIDKIYTYQTNETFADIGSVASYERINRTAI